MVEGTAGTSHPSIHPSGHARPQLGALDRTREQDGSLVGGRDLQANETLGNAPPGPSPPQTNGFVWQLATHSPQPAPRARSKRGIYGEPSPLIVVPKLREHVVCGNQSAFVWVVVMRRRERERGIGAASCPVHQHAAVSQPGAAGPGSSLESGRGNETTGAGELGGLGPVGLIHDGSWRQEAGSSRHGPWRSQDMHRSMELWSPSLPLLPSHQWPGGWPAGMAWKLEAGSMDDSGGRAGNARAR